MDIDKKIISSLWKTIKAYKNRILKEPAIRNYIMNDNNCKCIDTDYNYFIMFYLIQAISQKGGVQMLYNKLIDGGVGKKNTNKFLYDLLKMDLKTDKGIFSWNEIEEWNLDFDVVKKSTTKYSFF